MFDCPVSCNKAQESQIQAGTPDYGGDGTYGEGQEIYAKASSPKVARQDNVEKELDTGPRDTAKEGNRRS